MAKRFGKRGWQKGLAKSHLIKNKEDNGKNMKLNFKKALVTGGAGFIGSHIAQALIDEKCGVSIIDNLSTGHMENISRLEDKIEFYKGDIRNRDILLKASKGCDIIFHEAALVSVPQSVENPVESAMINEIGTLMVLEAARQNNVKRVVFASSSAIYGDNPESPKTEDMAPKPMSPYAVQKLVSEFNARLYSELYGLETVCLRYFNVFGPRQDPSSPYSGVISIFMKKVFSNEEPVIFGDGNQTRDFVFVKDVVKANLLAASLPDAKGQAFNVGTGVSITINELWEIISEKTGVKLAPEYAPEREGDIYESLSDISLAKSVLGFYPEYSFDDGIEVTMKWYKENNTEA